MSIHEEIKDQQKKLKDQSFKARWEYFWDYYKVHVIIGVIALIVIISTVRSFMTSKPFALYGFFLNSGYEADSVEIEEEYAQYAQIDTSKSRCLVDMSMTFNQTNLDQMTMAASQKITASIAAKEVDFLGADSDTFSYYASQDLFADLRTVFSEEELKAFGDNIYYVDRAYIEYIASDEYQNQFLNNTYDENNEYSVMAHKALTEGVFDAPAKENMKDPIPVGIILKNSAALKKAGAYTENKIPVVGIVSNTTRIDNAIMFLKYMSE